MDFAELKDFLKGNIDEDDLETLDDIHEEMEEGTWCGAGDRFGHTDDCFDRGMELGRAEAFKELLDLLEGGE